MHTVHPVHTVLTALQTVHILHKVHTVHTVYKVYTHSTCRTQSTCETHCRYDTVQCTYIHSMHMYTARGCNSSVFISENCDFLSQFDLLDIMFLLLYEKVKKGPVSLKKLLNLRPTHD